MSSNNYQIYINQTLQLVETMVIKSEATAEALNTWVRLQAAGYFDPVDIDPRTWKYYLNLAGEYHAIDRVMKVVSMDTLEEIIFNKENLKHHLATARAYGYGTRQYAELVAQYPDQETLILGILYPTDIEKAIAAKDGAILSYATNLVEENEYSLITKLQTWIDQFKARWYIPAYGVTDELYDATHFAIMHLLLVQAILTFRLAACNTNEAHSFHIRQYLGSHGYLDSYMDKLTKKQALFFYRNIAYIERNVGKRDTFNTLTEHIMTERYLPLAEYTMKHDVENQVENVYPEVIFRKKQLNLDIAVPADNRTSLTQMLSKQASLAAGNRYNLEEVEKETKVLLENSPSNVVATKSLESSMVDETNSSPWTLEEVLFNHWIYLASLDLYGAYVTITNPQTGESIPLTAKEAFIMAMYAYAKSIGKDLETIPLAYASRVQRIPTAGVNDIYSIVDPALVDKSIAVTALSMQPVIEPLIATEAFYALGVKINDAVQMQRRLIAGRHHHMARAQVQAMVTRIYSDHILELEPKGTRYDTWMSARNIDMRGVSRIEFDLLYTSIVSDATGLTLHPVASLKDLQKSMVSMFSKLSSYGIQVITEINDSNMRKLDTPYVRLGTTVSKLRANPHNPNVRTEVDKFSATLAERIPIKLNVVAPDSHLHTYITHSAKVEIGMRGDLKPDPTEIKVRASLTRLRIKPRTLTENIPRGWVDFIGITDVLKLTPAQMASMVDIYR